MSDARPSIGQTPQIAGVLRLLHAAQLPTSDLTDAHMDDFFYSGSATEPDAIVGIEICGYDALLRSLVVGPALRAHGVGSLLVAHAEAFARQRGARTLYLLTTTAESFFHKRGYLATSRETAPPAIRATTEFSGLCPSSSAFLSKRL